MFFCCLLAFFKINFFQKFFQEHYQSELNSWVQIRTDSPNCFQFKVIISAMMRNSKMDLFTSSTRLSTNQRRVQWCECSLGGGGGGGIKIGTRTRRAREPSHCWTRLRWQATFCRDNSLASSQPFKCFNTLWALINCPETIGFYIWASSWQTCVRGFWQGRAQTSLLSYRD